MNLFFHIYNDSPQVWPVEAKTASLTKIWNALGNIGDMIADLSSNDWFKIIQDLNFFTVLFIVFILFSVMRLAIKYLFKTSIISVFVFKLLSLSLNILLLFTLKYLILPKITILGLLNYLPFLNSTPFDFTVFFYSCFMFMESPLDSIESTDKEESRPDNFSMDSNPGGSKPRSWIQQIVENDFLPYKYKGDGDAYPSPGGEDEDDSDFDETPAEDQMEDVQKTGVAEDKGLEYLRAAEALEAKGQDEDELTKKEINRLARETKEKLETLKRENSLQESTSLQASNQLVSEASEGDKLKLLGKWDEEDEVMIHNAKVSEAIDPDSDSEEESERYRQEDIGQGKKTIKNRKNLRPCLEAIKKDLHNENFEDELVVERHQYRQMRRDVDNLPKGVSTSKTTEYPDSRLVIARITPEETSVHCRFIDGTVRSATMDRNTREVFVSDDYDEVFELDSDKNKKSADN